MYEEESKYSKEEQQIQLLTKKIKDYQPILDKTAQQFRTKKIVNDFDKWNHESWCFSVFGDGLVRLRLFTEQNFNFIETMSIVAVARYIFELSVWVHLFKLDKQYGLVYYAQLLDTQQRYWKDELGQIKREIALLEDFERHEQDALNDLFNQFKVINDPEKLNQMQKLIYEDIDKKASRHFSIYIEKAKTNGYGFQAHILRKKLIPKIELSISQVNSEIAAFDVKISHVVKNLNKGKWQWKQMAQKVGLTDEYEYIYTFSSKLLHATPASITTDHKNLEPSEIVVFLKYIDVKIEDILEIANEFYDEL